MPVRIVLSAYQNNMPDYGRNVRLYYAYAFTSNLAFSRAIFLLYLAQSGYSNSQIGILQSALFLATFICEIPTGYIGDKVGRKVSVLVGLLLLSLSAHLMLVFQWDYKGMLAVFVLSGIGYAFISGADRALLYDSLLVTGRSSEYVRVSARAQILSAMSLGAAMMAGGYMQRLSWSLVYNSYSVCLLIAALCILLTKEVQPTHPMLSVPESEGTINPTEAIKKVVFTRRLKVLLIFSLAYAIFESETTPYYIFGQRLFESYGLQPYVIGIIYALVQLLSSLSYLWAGRLEHSISLKRLIYLVVSGSVVIAALNTVPLLPIALVAFYFITVIPEVMYLLSENYLQQRITSKYRASLLSAHNFIQSCAITVSYLVWGYLLDRFPTHIAFAFTALLPLASLLIFALYFRAERLQNNSASLNIA